MKYYYGKRGTLTSGSFKKLNKNKSKNLLTWATSISDGMGSFHDIFKEQKNGNYKCLLCNTLTVRKSVKHFFMFYNIEDGRQHRQRIWILKRHNYDYFCHIPKNKSIKREIKTRKIKIKPDRNNFLWVEP